MTVVVVDTGPLIAHYCESDQYHGWVREQMNRLPVPLITCEPVLTETAFLLARSNVDPVRIVQAVHSGYLQVEFQISHEASSLDVLMTRYADTPMSLADACLVRLSELHKRCRVFTLDRHFQHYRRYGRSIIPLLSPW
jgi:predicted nucleic acid-binding protein